MKWFLFLLVALGIVKSYANYDYYRLPTSLRPTKYDLRILTHLEDPEKLRFEGTVNIVLEALENTRNITLHSKDLIIDESRTSLHQISGERMQMQISSTAINPIHDFYILKTCQLQVDQVYELSLSFSADLNRNLLGYYRSSYQDLNATRWISITQFEPSAARMAFPCFDEPGFKATFIITLGYHKKFTGLSNMPVKETKPHESLTDYIWSEFEESVPMSTYLVAFSVNDFARKTSNPPNGVLFRTWARPNAIDQCDFAAEFGPQVLQHYEDFFRIKFPLPKIDQIAIPDFNAGAMENWGLVTYREIMLLYSKAHSSPADKERLANVIAHELAHQWFGNLVTMEWWTDLWLNEGFATYMANLGMENVHPEWGAKARGAMSDLMTTFRLDALESSHPISRPIRMVSEISESFDQISYQKGSSVLRMMHLFLGEEAFRCGLNSYLQKYKYRNAEQDNLWESLSEAAHQYGVLPKSYDIKTIMDSWTLQTGYPVITVTRDYSSKTADVTQARFFLNSQLPSAKRKGCWWVPLSYTSQGELDFDNTAPKDWLECGKICGNLPKTIQDFPGDDQWVIFNTQLSTPYKVNYDAQNWKLLIETLTNGDFKHIHVMNRAQLIDDMMYLAWTGEQDYEVAFQLILYLRRERDFLPWKTAFDNLILLVRIMRQTPNIDLFRRFLRKLITPIYEHLQGINDTFCSMTEQDQILLKTQVVNWACQYQVLDCVSQALAYYRNWRSVAEPDKENPIPISIRFAVYCTAVRHGSEEDWEFLWARYLNSNTATEKGTILSSLGCTREIWLLQRYLELCFDPKELIRKQDSKSAFQAVAYNTKGYPLAKKYFMDNVDAIYKFYSPLVKNMGGLLLPLSAQVIQRWNLKKFKNFFRKSRKSLKGMEQSIQQSLEIMLTNVQWKKRNYHKFTQTIQRLL
ncbi:hypothetical protein KR009_004926 [Drosophila setifemur]|nr:hypothetical protein KR009_004926 [Drosophila setifemur]